MDPEIMSKITRLARYFKPYWTKSGECRTSVYWHGFWQENGKEKRVYIGKELPAELQGLYDSRFKPPGHTNYTWPGRRETGQPYERASEKHD